MDLVSGAKRVLVTMEHTAKDGSPKVLKRCSLPLTGRACVHAFLTDLAYLEWGPRGLELREVAPGVTPEQVQKATEAQLQMPASIRTMTV